MLQFLQIENIAVIEKAELSFGDGFNVLTGETGAGKSIVIDSINAVLGERTSRELIRSGHEAAKVCAVFDQLSNQARQAAAELEIQPDEDGKIILERTIFKSGKSLLKCNGRPVSASQIRLLAAHLINIHGQHDNQALLNPDSHVHYLDRLAENEDFLTAYTDEFHRFNRLRAHLRELDSDEEEKQRQIDLYRYQIEELTRAELKIGEMEELKQKSQIARNLESRIQSLSKALQLLRGSEDADGIGALTGEIGEWIVTAKSPKQKQLTALTEELRQTELRLEEEIEGELESFDGEEYDLDSIEKRLETVSGLCRKYGGSEETALAYLKTAQDALGKIAFRDEDFKKTAEELEKSQDRLIAAAQKLSESRRSAATVFEQEVSRILVRLNMPSVRFCVQISDGRYTKNGRDEVAFLITTNLGEEPKPLAKIASGGELSRVMLAIKSALADKDDVDTLIFDEIDTGISGRTAETVGRQLSEVARGHQVICVTHLAQIAVAAVNHLLIEKSEKEGRTVTEIFPLSGEARVREIARIMSGSQLNDSVLAGAAQILKNAGNQ